MTTLILRPTSVGRHTGLLDYPSSGNSYAKVDEKVSDGDTTYVYIDGSTGYDEYGITAPDDIIYEGTINSVTVYINCKNYDTTSASCKTVMRVNSTDYYGSSVDITGVSSYTLYSTTYTTNPSTSTAWTWSDFSGMEIGVYLSSTDQSRCTQVYVEIDYTLPNFVTIRPTSNGDTIECTQYPATGYNYDKVDEEVQDGSTTYVSTNTASWHVDLYNLADHTTETGTISKVSIFVSAWHGGFSWVNYDWLKLVIKTHSTVYSDSQQISGSSPSYRVTEYTTNPYTSAAWTWDEIDALQAGISLYSDTNFAMYCTQVFVRVYYTTGAASEDNAIFFGCIF